MMPRWQHRYANRDHDPFGAVSAYLDFCSTPRSDHTQLASEAPSVATSLSNASTTCQGVASWRPTNNSSKRRLSPITNSS